MADQVINCRQQQADVVLEVPDSVVAGVAQQAADLASGVVVVNVHPGSIAKLPRRSLANRALAVLGGEHRLEFVSANSVAHVQVGISLANRQSFELLLLKLGHVRQCFNLILHCIWASAFVLWTKRQMLQHLLVVKESPAESAGLQKPSTRTKFGFNGTNNFSSFELPSVLMIVSKTTMFAPMLDGSTVGGKLFRALNCLALGAYVFTILQARKAIALLREVPKQIFTLDRASTPFAYCHFRRTDWWTYSSRAVATSICTSWSRCAFVEFIHMPNLLATRTYSLIGSWLRRRLTVCFPVLLDEPSSGLSVAPDTCGHCIVDFFFGRFGHFVRCLLSSDIRNSCWHQPHGTMTLGLPPGCFLRFRAMENS